MFKVGFSGRVSRKIFALNSTESFPISRRQIMDSISRTCASQETSFDRKGLLIRRVSIVVEWWFVGGPQICCLLRGRYWGVKGAFDDMCEKARLDLHQFTYPDSRCGMCIREYKSYH